MKKFIATLLALSLALSLAACSNNDTTGDGDTGDSSQVSSSADEASTDLVNPAGVYPITNEKTTLEVMIMQRPYVSDLNENEVVKHIEEELNIVLDMTIVSESAWEEKVNIALSTGTYPEVIMSGAFTNADILNYGVDGGIFVPIEDEVAEYAVTLNALFEEQEYLQQDMTAPDGHMYGFPQVQGAYEHSDLSRKFWVNEEWLTNLGLDDPETTEDFKNMLLAFKNDDPNGNGIADEVPMSGAIQTWAAEPYWWVMNAFVPTEPYAKFSYLNADNELVFSPATDEWKEGLTYLADLYNEGLLDPAAFTNSLQQLEQLARNPDMEILGSYAAGHIQMGVVKYDDEDTRSDHWRALSIPESDTGLSALPYYSTVRRSEATFMITDKCENVAAAVRLADWMLSEEGHYITEKGILEEGRVRDAEDGELNFYGDPAKYYIYTDIEMEEMGHTIDALKTFSWGDTSLINKSASTKALEVASQDMNDASGYDLWLNDQYYKYFKDDVDPSIALPPVWLPIDKIEELSAIEGPLMSFIESSAVEFITGARSFDDWDGYLNDLNNMGYEEWFEAYSTAVNEVMN